MKIHCVQHVPFEGPAFIGTWAELRGYSLTTTKQYQDEKFPTTDDFDLLVVMGGPMSIHDVREFPWINEEKRFIEQSLHAGKKVLGVCLGAQFLADVLGARVFHAREKEIGWFPVRILPKAKTLSLIDEWPESFMAFHWHGETFDLPSGAIHLAETDLCPNQAFLYENQALALQFHLEVEYEGVYELVRHCAADLVQGPCVQTGDELFGTPILFESNKTQLFKLLDRW